MNNFQAIEQFNLYNQLITKSAWDKEFKRNLEYNPIDVMHQFGIHIDSDVIVKFVESDKKNLYLILPAQKDVDAFASTFKEISEEEKKLIPKNIKVWFRMMDKLHGDKTFRQRLLDSPLLASEEIGISFNPETMIHVKENSDKIQYLNLVDLSSEKLTDEQLNMVAGGGLLEEIGKIGLKVGGGAAGGAVVGGVIGSIIPGAGTAAGAYIGSLAGNLIGVTWAAATTKIT